MNRIVTFVVFLALGHSTFGQGTRLVSAQNFEQQGMQLISDTELSEAEMAQLLFFDFTPYREENESVIVKVVNGPNLELFSSQRLKTGQVDPIVLQAARRSEVSDEHAGSHGDVRAGENPIRMIQVRTVDVFNVDQAPN